jgi:hypothetical protein
MTEIIFNRNYIEKFYSANYFGSTTDYSDEEIKRNQERWIEEMKLLGWNLGDIILVEFDHAFKDILNVDKEDEFEKACEKALEKITRPDESEDLSRNNFKVVTEQVELSFTDEIMDTPSLNFTRVFEYEEGVPYTGDEIHFTDGTIWSVVLFSDLYPLLTMEENTVIFVPMSFEQGKEQGYVKDYYFSNDVKGVLKDALKGGAKIVRGVGVKK